MDHAAFRAFLRAEMERRRLSIREFAAQVKVSHTTIQRFVDENPAKLYVPTLDFLDKLSIATGASLNTLLAICFPESARKLEIDPEVAIICDMAARLPIATRQAVLRFMRSFED